jgi:lipopolysaccharide transport system ATP-binding protein
MKNPMQNNQLIWLDHVSKDFLKSRDRLSGMTVVWDILRGRAVQHNFRALSDISLELRRGESLGIIGENGAGKSTLLKIIAGVVTATSGAVIVNGRVGALLELGAGFHPEYTGRANIKLAGALLGLTSSEIAEKSEEIVAFADLGTHIDDLVKTYSSGMVLRLGFAVASALDPDILITDEVLSVGDESFQKKCMAWVEGYLSRGGTLLLCSHSMYHIKLLCRNVIWLKEGKVARYGSADSVTQDYLAYHDQKSAEIKRPMSSTAANAAGYYAVQCLKLHPSDELTHGALLRISGDIFSPDDRAPIVLIGIVRADGTPIYGVSSEMDNHVLQRREASYFKFELEFPNLDLLPGKYVVRAHALDPEGVRLFDHVETSLSILGESREQGLVRLPHQWHMLAKAD